MALSQFIIYASVPSTLGIVADTTNASSTEGNSTLPVFDPYRTYAPIPNTGVIVLASLLILIANGIIALCLIWIRSYQRTKATVLGPIYELSGPTIPVELKEDCRYEVGCPSVELKEDALHEMHVMPAELRAGLLPELESTQL